MNKFERISCHRFIEIDGYAYFSNVFYNGLFRAELKTGKTTFLGFFQDEERDAFNMHWEVFRQEDSIYFFPRRGRYVHIYSLNDQSISAIEIRKKSEEPFRIEEIVLEGMNVILLPLEENAPIKNLNLSTRTVTKIEGKNGIFKNSYLLHESTPFPESSLDKYQIEQVAGFSWKRMPDGRYCAFLLMGRDLLWYTPETQKFESVPLTVINKAELDTYLKSMKQLASRQDRLKENRPFSLQAYLYTHIWQSTSKTNGYRNDPAVFVGGNIWYQTKVKNYR